MTAVLLAIVVGLLQGLRHALEPDHVTAVATMAAAQRTTRATVGFALAWGVGHALVLAAVGAVLVALRAEMPIAMTLVFEIAVGVVLVLLGVRALAPAPAIGGAAPSMRRPMLVGVVHGLAGTGGITALAIAGAPGRAAAIAALVLYAAGAVVGMCLVAGAAGPLLARASRRPRLGRAIVSVGAFASIALGVVWSGKSLLALIAS